MIFTSQKGNRRKTDTVEHDRELAEWIRDNVTPAELDTVQRFVAAETPGHMRADGSPFHVLFVKPPHDIGSVGAALMDAAREDLVGFILRGLVEPVVRSPDALAELYGIEAVEVIEDATIYDGNLVNLEQLENVKLVFEFIVLNDDVVLAMTVNVE